MRSIRPVPQGLRIIGVALIVAAVAVAAVLLGRSGDSPSSSSNLSRKGPASPAAGDQAVKKAQTLTTPGAAIEVVNAAGRRTASGLRQGESVSTTITGFPANRKGMQSFVGECAVLRTSLTVCDTNEISRFVPDRSGTGRARVVVRRTFNGMTDQGANAGRVDCARVGGGCFLVALAVEGDLNAQSPQTKVMARVTKPLSFR